MLFRSATVYLSLTMDCFDGVLVTWRISEHLNAALVNGMLDDVIATIDEDYVSIINVLEIRV